MKKTIELYNMDPLVFKGLPYEEAIKLKIEKCNELISALLEVDYKTRDTNRLETLLKAKKYNEILLEELNE